MLERFCFVYFHVHLGRVITRTLLVLRCICTYPESWRLTHQIFQCKFSELTFPLFTDKLTIMSTSINTGIISWYIVLYLYLIKRLRHEVCNVFLFVKKKLASVLRTLQTGSNRRRWYFIFGWLKIDSEEIDPSCPVGFHHPWFHGPTHRSRRLPVCRVLEWTLHGTHLSSRRGGQGGD